MAVRDPALFEPRSLSTRAIPLPRMRPGLEGLVCALVMIVALGASTGLTYLRAREAVLREIREGLIRLASSAALSIDGDVHRLLKSSDQRTSAEFLALAGKLESLRKASAHVRYAYTNVWKDGKVFFIVDNSPQYDIDGDGIPDDPPEIMSPYPDASPSLIRALTEQIATVDDEPYTDRWGTFISAYAPFFDSQHRFVGTVGLDLDLADLAERLQPLQHALKRLSIISVLFGIFFGVLVWYFRRQILQISELRRGMLADVEWAVALANDADRRELSLLSFLGHTCSQAETEEQPSAQKSGTCPGQTPDSSAAGRLEEIFHYEGLNPEKGVLDKSRCAAAVAAYLAVVRTPPMEHPRNVELRTWFSHVLADVTTRNPHLARAIRIHIDEALPEKLWFDPRELGLIVQIVVLFLTASEDGPLTLAMTIENEDIHEFDLGFSFIRKGTTAALSLPLFVEALSANGTGDAQTGSPRRLSAAIARRWLARCGARVGTAGKGELEAPGFCLTVKKAVEEASAQ